MVYVYRFFFHLAKELFKNMRWEMLFLLGARGEER